MRGGCGDTVQAPLGPHSCIQQVNCGSDIVLETETEKQTLVRPPEPGLKQIDPVPRAVKAFKMTSPVCVWGVGRGVKGTTTSPQE